MRLIRILPALVLLSLFVRAQTAGFATASVKPAATDRVANPTLTITPGRFTARDQTLLSLICMAYQLRPYQVTGGPAWMTSDRFDIAAETDAPLPSNSIRVMVRVLLAERFQLRVTRQTRNGSLYLLTVVKGGAKLDGFVDDTKLPAFPNLDVPDGAPPIISVTMNSYSDSGQTVTMRGLRARQSSMALFAQFLGGALDRPVTDKTGIAGNYDFALLYSADATQSDPKAPSIFSALQAHLGLKLESATGPIPLLLIRSASKPTPDQ